LKRGLKFKDLGYKICEIISNRLFLNFLDKFTISKTKLNAVNLFIIPKKLIEMGAKIQGFRVISLWPYDLYRITYISKEPR